MAFAFSFSDVSGETTVDIEMMLEDDGPNGNWTWLQSSRSHPMRLEPSEWPEGLAKSVDHRNTARRGQEKGRVLIISSGPHGKPEALSPVAVMSWHVHGGNWPLAVLDLGYRLDLDVERGRLLVEDFLLAALGELNDRREFQDTQIARPTDRLGWAIRHQDGAGSDKAWGRTVAMRAQADWGFRVVKPKSARPHWAREGFYGERPR
ncbi:MAG: hypothetical protein ACYDHH_17950 [Solirubrobacteraceae bacterium]